MTGTCTRRPVRVATAFAGLFAVSLAVGCSGDAVTPPTSASSASAAAMPTAPVSPSTAVPALDGHEQDGVVGASPAPPSVTAQRTAEEFMRAWARPHVPAEAWLSGVRRLAVVGYGELLATVDPANVPATTVTGRARPVLASAERADFDVPTDARAIRVTCVRDGRRWLVAAVAVPGRP